MEEEDERQGQGKPIARSTQYYRKHYAKNKKPSFKPRRVPRPVAVKHPLLLLAESIKLREQQQVSDSEFEELPLNKLNVSSHEEIQQTSRPDDGDDWITEDEEHQMESDGDVLECPGMFSTGDGSTDEEVGPKEPIVQRKRRKLRKRVIRERLDSDDALTTSSESSASHSSSLFEAPSPVPSPEPHLLQSPESCATDSVYEVVSEENETEREKTSAPRKVTGKPLCPCTEITAEEVMFMTLVLGLRHGLTWVAQVDILKMIATIFKSASIPTSKHLYKERLNVKDEKDIKYHVFCSDCSLYLGEKPKNTKSKYCTTCEKKIKVTSSINCFVSLSVEAQLQKFLQDDYFVKSIMTHRFNRPSTPGVYSEIYDGKVYKQFSADGGILSSPYNFSFTFFTDGVAFGKSSNKTIWPIYLTVNELPYYDRKKYFLLAGVYAGPKDPNQLYFLKPFVDMMNNLSSRGVDWFYNGSRINSIAICICAVVDSVARFQVLNFTNFFGYYGCTFCYVHSQYILKAGSRYPVTNEPAPARNYEDYKADLLAVSAMKPTYDRAYRGVKGTCNLINLKYFSIFDHFVVDYMHNLLIGCVQKHTKLILQSPRKKMWIDVYENNISMKTLKAVIDERIASVQSNTAVIRELRGITHLALWRANEWQQWLLFYFVTCLTGLLKQKFILHFSLLSKAAFILLKKSVTDDDLNMAHRLLMCYTFYFQKCFGEKNMVYNIHLLSHVVQGVYNFGPIWSHSSFMYESQNRYLLQLCKSPNSVSLQVARKFSIFQSLPHLSESLGCSDKVIDFSEGIVNYKRLVKCQRANDNQCVLMGQPQLEGMPTPIRNSLGTTSENCLLYQRCIYKNYRYTTSQYCEGIANNDSYLYLRSGECVNIQKIMKVPDTQRVFLLVQIVAVDRKPLYQNNLVKYDCISKVIGFKAHKLVRLEDIDEPCLLISVSGIQYVARLPYGCTVE